VKNLKETTTFFEMVWQSTPIDYALNQDEWLKDCVELVGDTLFHTDNLLIGDVVFIGEFPNLYVFEIVDRNREEFILYNEWLPEEEQYHYIPFKDRVFWHVMEEEN
jgi:ribosomal 30S subunit maturation factor RimM